MLRCERTDLSDFFWLLCEKLSSRNANGGLGKDTARDCERCEVNEVRKSNFLFPRIECDVQRCDSSVFEAVFAVLPAGDR